MYLSSASRLRSRAIRGAGGVARVRGGGGARGGGGGYLGLQLPPQPVRQWCCPLEARGRPRRHIDCRGRALRGQRVQVLRPATRRSSGCYRRRWQRGWRGALANWFVEHLGKMGGQRGWCGEWRGRHGCRWRGEWRGACGWQRVRGSVSRLRSGVIRGAGGVARVRGGGGARRGGVGSLGLPLPPVRQSYP